MFLLHKWITSLKKLLKNGLKSPFGACFDFLYETTLKIGMASYIIVLKQNEEIPNLQEVEDTFLFEDILNAVPAVIDETTFEKVQRRLKK